MRRIEAGRGGGEHPDPGAGTVGGLKRGVGGFVIVLTAVYLGTAFAHWTESRRQTAELEADYRLMIERLVVELEDSFDRGHFHASEFVTRIDQWRQQDRRGFPAVPGYYRIPGAPLPPQSAWQLALDSGAAALLPAELRMELAYYYEEYTGLYANYLRLLEVTERELMPLELEGAEAFYGRDGKLRPVFRIHMELQLEFASDLVLLSDKAGQLAERLTELTEENRPSAE